jgi:proteasome accessory factor C
VLPVEESVALIEQALREGYALAMDYYTAGRDVVTHREVEPHRLEQRGKAMYLIGFCRRVQDERVFRVDRIRSLELVPLPEERYTGWDL